MQIAGRAIINALMLIRRELDRTPITISLTSRALTLGRNDEFIAAWDLGGRLYSVVEGDITSRRGLQGRILIKSRDRGVRLHRWASQEEASAIVDRAAAFAGNVLRAAGDVPDEVASALQRAARFKGEAAIADAARFAQIYRPIGILPPDQYLALVLQATEGCSFRSCTFCEFYREPYRVKSPEQFGEHVADVLAYLDGSLSLRDRAIFLGSANALAVPTAGLVPIFDMLATRFTGRPVYAFQDGFTGTLKTAADYAALHARGLRRVYIGLESGHDELLAFVRKPSTSQQAIDTVRSIKAGGVNVGVIVMIGLGGSQFAEAHVADTAHAVNQMGLGAGDLLYFSDLVAVPGSPYFDSAESASLAPLDAGERVAQRSAIVDRLVFPSSRPQIATYDIREFVY
jgi:radical SAM superfamily enzyme YgiQ (UPF0313 family)